MTWTSLIRIGPAYDPHVVLGPVHGGGTLYERGAFRTLDREIPVVVDHDMESQIGVVRELAVIEDTDGAWFAALATLDASPAWLKPGTTRASFGFKSLRRRELNKWDVVADAILDEVSVLHSLEPVEPRAKVLTLRRTESVLASSSPARVSDRPDAGGEIIWGGGLIRRRDPEMDELWRRLDVAGDRVDTAVLIEDMKREIAQYGRLLRLAA